MILTVLHYGHPTLRKKGDVIPEITSQIRQLIQDMKDTMYAARGVGLAAQQVGHALQLTVVDVRGVEDRPSTLHWHGQPVSPDDYMPMVLINPKVTPAADPVAGPEGCLSFPEIYSDISRPEQVEVTATNGEGENIRFRCGGLLARAIQHEVDHLNGILFIDRMTAAAKQKLKPDLDEIQAATKEALKKSAKQK